MFGFRVIAVAVLISVVTMPAFAGTKVQAKAGPDGADASASALANDPEGAVRQLYSPYLSGGDEDKSAFDNETERGRRFSADLVKQLSAYFKAQEKVDEPGGLDFDPIVNGQDYKIDRLDVRVDKVVAGKSAIVVATFRNFDESAKLKYNMVFERGNWRVDNIASLSDPLWDLREILNGS